MRSTKIIKICSSSLCTCLHHMVILRTRNKITYFLMILAWASPFKPRKIESERRSASKTSNLRISLFTSIKDRHCIQATRILVHRPAINANDPMPPFRRIWCELRSVTARTKQNCLNPHHRQCWTNVVTQQTQNICITFVQLWPNVSDVVPALYKCYRSTNVLCLLGRRCHHGNSLVYVDTSQEFSFSH